MPSVEQPCVEQGLLTEQQFACNPVKTALDPTHSPSLLKSEKRANFEARAWWHGSSGYCPDLRRNQ